MLERSDLARHAPLTWLRRRVRRWRRMPYASPLLWLRRVAFWAGAVIVGLVAIVFAALADRASAGFARLVAWQPLCVLAVAPAGFALAVFLTRRVFPGAQGSGIPQVMVALEVSDPRITASLLSLRIAAGKIVLTLLGLACGAAIGREGPTVQVGAAIMHAMGRVLRLPRIEARRGLVLAGGAAGVAAAFNTPLAGIVFAIEELSHTFEARTSGTVLTAVIVAGITTMALVGNYSYFGVTTVALDIGPGWLAILPCGIIGGAAGGLFSKTLVWAARGLAGFPGRLPLRRPVAFAALCGLVVAVIGLLSHGTTYGTGYAQARRLVEGHGGDLPGAFFLLKLAAATASYLSGIPGGVFAPSLSIGAGLGAWLSQVVPSAQPGAVVLLGMVAYFAGVVQAPITASVIVMEMTANQAMTIPLLATAMLALAVSRLVCRRPLYGALARVFLRTLPARPVVLPPTQENGDVL